MDAKLTLKLDQYLIERAQNYASRKNTSLSRIIENYLDTLTNEQTDDFEISPFVRSFSSGKGLVLDSDQIAREDYTDYFDEKYK